jgi:hypothetical protein
VSERGAPFSKRGFAAMVERAAKRRRRGGHLEYYIGAESDI